MKYKSEDYFSVLDKRTGRKICDCSDEIDALMMVSFDPANRTISRNQFLMSQVIDVEIQKQLPTSNVTVSNTKENGCSPRKEQLEDVTPLKLPQSDLQPLDL